MNPTYTKMNVKEFSLEDKEDIILRKLDDICEHVDVDNNLLTNLVLVSETDEEGLRLEDVMHGYCTECYNKLDIH